MIKNIYMCKLMPINSYYIKLMKLASEHYNENEFIMYYN